MSRSHSDGDGLTSSILLDRFPLGIEDYDPPDSVDKKSFLPQDHFHLRSPDSLSLVPQLDLHCATAEARP